MRRSNRRLGGNVCLSAQDTAHEICNFVSALCPFTSCSCNFTYNGIKNDRHHACHFSLIKSLAEFAAAAANKIKSIFSGGVYLGKNTSRSESVEFVRLKRANYALLRPQSYAENLRRSFSAVSNGRRQRLSFFLSLVRYRIGSEKHRYAPQCGKTYQSVYDTAHNARLASAEKSYNVKAEKAYTAPVYAADYGEDKGYTVYYHKNCSFPKVARKIMFCPFGQPCFPLYSFQILKKLYIRQK